MSDTPRQALAQTQDGNSLGKLKFENLADSLAAFDWKQLPPPLMAQVLMQKPYRGKSGVYYLNFAQATVFALRAFELGLSPISSEVWFNPETWTAEPTVEGHQRLCRLRGVDVSPPRFEDTKREWPRYATPHPNLKDDFGKKCIVEVQISGKWFPSEYIAWFSEWFRPTPMWQRQPDHMLQVRAYGNVLQIVSGIGISGLPSERDEDVSNEQENPNRRGIEYA